MAEEKQVRELFKREKAIKLDDENICLWYNRIDDLIEWLGDHWNGWKSWKAAYELDRLIQWAEKEMDDKNITSDSEDIGKITVPLIANHIRNLIPFLFIKDPIFYGRPFNQDDFRHVLAQMDYLNFAWREYKMSKQVKRSILDAAIIGHGVAKTGWTLELNDVSEQGKGIISYYDYIKKEAPWVRRVNPFLFFFDRFAPDFDLDSARWCGEIIVAPIQDIVDNEKYDLTVRQGLYDGSIRPTTLEEYKKKAMSDGQNDFLFGKKNDKDKDEYTHSPSSLALIYEIWDKKFNQTITLIATDDEESRKRALRVQQNPYDYLDNFCYEKVDFEEVPNDFYGMGHARYLVDIQKQINRNRNKIYAITRMFNPMWVYSGADPLPTTEAQKLKENIPGDTVNLPPNSQLVPLETPKISIDLYQANQLLDKDFSELSGDDILARGGLLPSRTSAEEIRERSKLRGLRLETNVQNTNDFTLNIGKKIIMHARKYLKAEKAISVIGRPGVLVTTVKRDNMDAKFSIDMSVISKTLDPPEIQRQGFAQMFQLFTNPNMLQLLQQYQVPMNFGALIYKYLETFDINEVEIMFPGYSQFQTQVIPEDFVPFNTGNQTSMAPTTTPPSTIASQIEGVDPNSMNQGMEGMMSQLMGGGNPNAGG